MSESPEEPLVGGNASGTVVRVGGTVRKPWTASTEHVVSLMRRLRQAGLDVPAPLGRDDRGRLVLEYIPGTPAQDTVPLDVPTVRVVGTMIRRIHDACATAPVPQGWEVLIPTPGADLVCHNDLAPWNLIVDGERLVFIDWDGAGPSTRSWDLAYAAIAFGHLFPGGDVTASARRLTALVDGYGADPGLRHTLATVMVERSAAMYDLLHRAHAEDRQPWARMFVEGHGAHWDATTTFIRQHTTVWRIALRS